MNAVYDPVMSRESALPEYKGPLGSAPWSGFELTEEIRRSLRRAALKGCKACFGDGFLGSGEKVQVCHCVNRREDGAT